MGERTPERRNSVFPHLLPKAHICVPDDCGRQFTRYASSDVGALVDANCSSLRAGFGREPVRCDEEIGSSSGVVHLESNRIENNPAYQPGNEANGPHEDAIN